MKPKRTILCVDDNEQSLSIRKVMLETRGYRVISCTNGQDALEHFKQGGVDLVLTDLIMPGLDGHTLIEAIKSLSPQTPAILFSGKTKIYERDMRADLFLPKGMYAPRGIVGTHSPAAHTQAWTETRASLQRGQYPDAGRGVLGCSPSWLASRMSAAFLGDGFTESGDHAALPRLPDLSPDSRVFRSKFQPGSVPRHSSDVAIERNSRATRLGPNSVTASFTVTVTPSRESRAFICFSSQSRIASRTCSPFNGR